MFLPQLPAVVLSSLLSSRRAAQDGEQGRAAALQGRAGLGRACGAAPELRGAGDGGRGRGAGPQPGAATVPAGRPPAAGAGWVEAAEPRAPGKSRWVQEGGSSLPLPWESCRAASSSPLRSPNGSSGCSPAKGSGSWVFLLALGRGANAFGGGLVLLKADQGGSRLCSARSVTLSFSSRERFPGLSLWSCLLGVVFGSLPVPVPR